MTPLDALLDRLEGVKPRPNGRYYARCPAHEDRAPSLSVRETESGSVLIHCFAGCSPAEVVAALGLSLSDLFPPRPATEPRADGSRAPRPQRPPPDYLGLLRLLSREALIVRLAASDIRAKRACGDETYERLALAQERIEQIAAFAGGHHW